MTAALIVITVLIVAVLVLTLLARRRAASRAGDTARDDPEASSTATESAGEPTDPAPAGAERTIAAWDAVAGAPEGAPDPAGPPAAIHIAVTGTHPWAPIRAFLAELQLQGYVTTVELPDLVVLRDLERSPVTIREPAAPPGHLIVTTIPENMGAALQALVTTLLSGSFSIARTDGRDVHLVDDEGIEVHLTVTELALT